MKKNNVLHRGTAMIGIFLILLFACNTQVNEKGSKADTSVNSTRPDSIELIPDSVIQYLITSAAQDFNEHQPPIAIDIRNVKAGYTSSGKEKTYLICGEFLSQEKKDWEKFTTIKTSHYEQYIGGNMYCQKATFVEKSNSMLSEGIKNRLNILKK